MNRIENKTAIITGSTRGIGLAIARALLERGARVLVCARKKDEVEEVVESLRKDYGERAFGTTCDVRDYEQVKMMFEEGKRLMGGVDILVNNAGIGAHANVGEMSIEAWRATIETNLSAVFYCCREALPLMKERGGGYIINIGSLAGKNPIPGMAAYCASKFGLLGFSESLMQEVRYDHIRVSCIMPGSVDTGFGGNREGAGADWKIASEDVAEVVVNLLELEPRALASRIEIRPSEPKK